MASPFTLFQTTTFTFLKLNSAVDGNIIEQEYQSDGIFKERNSMVQNGTAENPTSEATLKVRPEAAFLADVGGNVVGHGVRVSKNGADAEEYRITAQVEGYDFDEGVLEFYHCTLKRESIAAWETSQLPLE